jgi:hypothetical protein
MEKNKMWAAKEMLKFENDFEYDPGMSFTPEQKAFIEKVLPDLSHEKRSGMNGDVTTVNRVRGHFMNGDEDAPLFQEFRELFPLFSTEVLVERISRLENDITYTTSKVSREFLIKERSQLYTVLLDTIARRKEKFEKDNNISFRKGKIYE